MIEQVGSFQICCHPLIHDVERVAFLNYTGCKMWKFDIPLRNWKYRARVKVWEVNVKQSSRHLFSFVDRTKGHIYAIQKIRKDVWRDLWQVFLDAKWLNIRPGILLPPSRNRKKNHYPDKLKYSLRRHNSHPNGYPQSFFPGINYPNVIELSICDKPLFEVTGIKTECPLFVKENASEILCSSSCLIAWNDGEQVVWMMWILRGLYSS